MNLDFWTMFWAMLPALMITALIQEGIIKPFIQFLKHYYHKSKKMVIDSWPNNEK